MTTTSMLLFYFIHVLLVAGKHVTIIIICLSFCQLKAYKNLFGTEDFI